MGRSSGGDYATIGQAMHAIGSAATAETPHVIMLAPGTYTEPLLTLKPHVSIHGSGTQATIISSPVNFDPVLVGTGALGHIEIRDLTLRHTGDVEAVALRVSDVTGSVTVRDVALRANTSATVSRGAVVDEEDQSDDTVAIRAVNNHIAADDRVDVVMLPIADGLTIARKR